MRSVFRSILLAWLAVNMAAEIGHGKEPQPLGSRVFFKSRDFRILWQQQVVDCNFYAIVREAKDDRLRIHFESDGTEGWFHRDEVCTPYEAIEFFTNRIAANPNDADAYLQRCLANMFIGKKDQALSDSLLLIQLRSDELAFDVRAWLWHFKGEYELAIKCCNEAIRINPKFACAYFSRSRMRVSDSKEESVIQDIYKRNIADLDEAINVYPNYIWALRARGAALSFRLREYEKARNDFDKVLLIDATDTSALTSRAWILATCPDERLRDGAKAVRDMLRVRELGNGSWEIQTAAAAYAEAGDFKSAVEWQEKAWKRDRTHWQKEIVNEIKLRLELYRAGKPYRAPK